MIAVLAKAAESVVVREFFELFKTPWEFYRSDGQPDVLICSDTHVPGSSARLVLVYGSEEKAFDRDQGISIHSRRPNPVLSYKRDRLPIFGNALTFKSSGSHLLVEESTQEPVGLEVASGDQTMIRIGYDLFYEIRHLLTRGQPFDDAGIPSLEMHIALLRDLILGSSIPLVEIPPVPVGYSFIACLPHDVDHVGVRNHKCDHTMLGFLYRATLGSVIHFFTGRKSLRQLIINWRAALSLPFVHLGLAKDFWHTFNQYLQIEKGLTSTFFVIPKKGDPGQDANGHRPAKRAVQYEVGELTDDLHQLQSAGCEIGVHGIDAWRDSAKGREELERISSLTGKSELGVRMHWLFFDEQSPVVLENAGFTYDSTVGYNNTVGYRAGTTQAFKPLQVTKLLELPMHVMDTALFYPSYLNLSPKQAQGLVRGLINNVVRYGGVFTVNWHDRSIAPERLWDDFYVNLLDDLKSRGAWFATASQTVSWFKKRRSAVVEKVTWEGERVRVKASANRGDDNLPGLKIRIHKASARRAESSVRTESAPAYVDVPFERIGDALVAW